MARNIFLNVVSVLVLISSIPLATPSPSLRASLQGTNAQRMARGLPPKRPENFGRSISGFAQDIPSKVVAPRTNTSLLPPSTVTYTGRLQVHSVANEGSSLGFVRNAALSDGSGNIGEVNFLGPERELHVSLTAPLSGQGPFDIMATNAVFNEPFYIGAAGTFRFPAIGPGISMPLAFSNVEQTPPGSVPLASASTGRLVESAIWSINPTTKELTAQWINPDGTKPETIFAYDIRANGLFIVGDLAEYNAHSNFPASAVKLFLADI